MVLKIAHGMNFEFEIEKWDGPPERCPWRCTNRWWWRPETWCGWRNRERTVRMRRGEGSQRWGSRERESPLSVTQSGREGGAKKRKKIVIKRRAKRCNSLAIVKGSDWCKNEITVQCHRIGSNTIHHSLHICSPHMHIGAWYMHVE